MISGMPCVVSTIVASILLIASGNGATQSPALLFTIDQVVSGLSVGLMVSALLWVAFRPGCDPLVAAPLRPNQLREDSVALAICAYLTAALVLQGVVPLVVGTEPKVVSTVAVSLSVSCAGIAICLVLAARYFDGGVQRFLLAEEGGVGAMRTVALIGVLTLLAIGLCPIVRDSFEYAVHFFIPGFEFASHPTIEALHGDDRSWPTTVALWVGAVLLAPIAEEFFFRGLLQTLLVRVLRRRWAAIAVTSIAFGAIHFPQPQAVLALIVLSVLIGFAYERTGSLLPPILIHALFNLKTLVWDALGAFPALTPFGN